VGLKRVKKRALPLVSVVTPSFNQGQFLEACIQSVLVQDYPRLEYIIVDGGSTDGSVDVLEKYSKRLAWWVSEPDSGQTEAINKGFARAKGDVLAWLNSDDVYEPRAIGRAALFLHEHPAIGMAYGRANYIDAAGRIVGSFPAAQTDYRRLRRGYVHIPQQSAFFRASLWKQVGPLDPSFYFAMDYDLWTRIAARAEIKFVDGEPWAGFRIHPGGKTTAADDRCWPEMLRVHYRDGGSFASTIVMKYHLRRLFGKLWNWRRHLRAAGAGDR
jgi:glycosyltransferase involved in cell wall biosynthesis